MYKILLIALTVVMLSSCLTTTQIGKVNMISNRNIDSKGDYVVIKSYIGGTRNELKKLKGETLEQAIDNVVRNVPGGEFIKNVKIYVVNNKYYAVEGDVWGYSHGANFKGFKVGDYVQRKDNLKIQKGQIVDLKNENSCTVKMDKNGDLRAVKYTDLLRSGE